MPRRKEERPTEKITLYLYEEDWDKLKRLYPRIGASKIVRLIVGEHLRKLREKQPTLDLDLEVDP